MIQWAKQLESASRNPTGKGKNHSVREVMVMDPLAVVITGAPVVAATVFIA
jgi:hypothetical protein